MYFTKEQLIKLICKYCCCDRESMHGLDIEKFMNNIWKDNNYADKN